MRGRRGARPRRQRARAGAARRHRRRRGPLGGGPGRRARRWSAAGACSGAVLYRYFDDLPVAGYEWAYGDSAAAGLIPTNEGLTCVFVAASPDRCGGCAGRAPSRRVRRADGHGRARPAARVHAPRRSAGSRLGRRTRLPAPVLGCRVGAGRRRRLLQGPDHHPWHDRRDERRGAARGRAPGRRWPAHAPSPWRWPATRRSGTGCRAPCSPPPTRIAAYDWDLPRCRRCCARSARP